MASGISRIWFIAPAAVLLMVVLTWWSARTQTAVSNAFTGQKSAVVSLKVEGDAKEAGRHLAERMAVMGVDAQVVEASGSALKLRIRRVAEPQAAIAGVLTPEPLQLFAMDPVQSTGDSDSGSTVRPLFIGNSRQEVLDKVTAARLPEGTRTALECMTPRERGAPTMCAAWRLGEQLLPDATAQLKDIEVGADVRTEEPLVTMTFNEEGAKALVDFTARNEGKLLAVVALGEVQARPAIDEPLQGGGLRFSTRTDDTDRTEAVARAQRIDATLHLPRLPAMTIEQVEEAQ